MREQRFHVYPYREEFVGTAPDSPGIPRPTVDILFGRGETQDFPVRGLIDTGAPGTVFVRGVAELLGIKLGEPGARYREVDILGGQHKAEPWMVHLTLPPFTDISWETEVWFLRAEQDVPFAGVLGQQGFLDRWVVSFNYPDHYFVVEEHESFVERMPVDTFEVFQQGFYDSEWAPPSA